MAVSDFVVIFYLADSRNRFAMQSKFSLEQEIYNVCNFNSFQAILFKHWLAAKLNTLFLPKTFLLISNKTFEVYVHLAKFWKNYPSSINE